MLRLDFHEAVLSQSSHDTVEVDIVCDHFMQPLWRVVSQSGMEKLIPNALIVEVGEQTQ